MQTPRKFAQVDVFSDTAFMGNPVAVILSGDGLSTTDMQRIARWTNLSETTFVLPPSSADADYRLRIFTPNEELPFAGHPTLGSAHAWRQQHPEHTGDSVIQECGAGLVEIRRIGNQLFFRAPETKCTGPLSDAEVAAFAEALGVDTQDIIGHQWVDNGPGWAAVQLASAAEVTALVPDFTGLPDARIGVLGAHPDGSPHAFEIRAFVPGVGVYEDPVTGSLNAAVAQWLIRDGRAPKNYTATQGGNIGRAGIISISTDSEGEVWVGGSTTTIINGEIAIP